MSLFNSKNFSFTCIVIISHAYTINYYITIIIIETTTEACKVLQIVIHYIILSQGTVVPCILDCYGSSYSAIHKEMSVFTFSFK